MTGALATTGFTSTGIDDNATSTAITIDASENVGIGAAPKTWSSERSALQVNGITSLAASAAVAGSAGILYHNSYMNAAGLEKYIVADEASAYMQQNGNHYLKTAAVGTADATITWTTAMTIDNNGKTLMNTVSSSDNTDAFKITNNSTASWALNLNNAGQSNYILITAQSGTGTVTHHQFNNSNGEVGTIKTLNSSTHYNTSSDYRLKELDVPMEGSIDRLKLLRPINFAWKVDGSRTDGFFAHEAGEVVPECATGTKDAMRDEEYEVTPAVMDGETVVTEAVMGTRSVPDYQGIDQSKLSPLTISALQEAITLIEQLTARVTELENA